MGGTGAQGITRVGQTALVKLVEIQICHLQPKCGEVSTKEQWLLPALLSGESYLSSLHSETRQFSSSLCVPGIFQFAAPALYLKASEYVSK